MLGKKNNMMEKQRQMSGFKDNNWCSFMLCWLLDVMNSCEVERKNDSVDREEDLGGFGQKF